MDQGDPEWTGPWPEATRLLGRRDELERLAAVLEGPPSKGAVVAPLGGGASTLAASAARAASDRRLMAWVRASSRAAAVEDLAAAARDLGLARAEGGDQPAALARLGRWLRANEGWVVVLDGLGRLAPPEVRPLLGGEVGPGHLLVTTDQEPDFQSAVEVGLGPLSVGASIELAARCGAPDPEALARSLGGHALDLVLGAASAAHGAALSGEVSLPALAAEAARLAGPEGEALARALAWLEAGPIPAGLVAALVRGSRGGEGAEVDPVLALEPLLGLALLARGAAGLVMHPAVAAALRDPAWAGALAAAEAAAAAATRAFRPAWRDPESWAAAGAVLPNALAAAERASDAGAATATVAPLLGRVSRHLLRQLRAEEALDAARRRRRLLEADRGEDLTPLASALHEEGRAARAAGDLDGAREALSQALALDAEAGAGELGLGAVPSLHEIARVEASAGDLAAAFASLERALSLCRGGDSPDELLSSGVLWELARIRQAQGALDAAAVALEEAVEIKLRILGTDRHANVAAGLHELAGIHRDRGDLDRADELLGRALEIRRGLSGAEAGPEVAATLHELGGLALVNGDAARARALLTEALELKQGLPGDPGADVSSALTQESLAAALLDLGAREEAREALAAALATFRRVLGPVHRHARRVEARLRHL